MEQREEDGGSEDTLESEEPLEEELKGVQPKCLHHDDGIPLQSEERVRPIWDLSG